MLDDALILTDPGALRAANEGKSRADLHLQHIGMKGENVLFHRAQDMTPYLLENKDDRKHTQEDWARGKDMKRVASIPIGMWNFLEVNGIADDPKELAKFLDRNPEYKTVEKNLS